ncbi:MAG: ROK family transcriptional regulator [Spirochaetaceae bacterium]|nr:ROK family transcriptional regulator [Spirochaetaceae bacterium]
MNNNPMRASEIRIHNINMVLTQIYKNRDKGISQSELVSETGLKAPTIFRIFNELEKRGSIKAIKSSKVKNNINKESKKGRKPLLYTIVPNSVYSITIEFYAGSLCIGLFNFSEEKISEIDSSIDENLEIEGVIDLMISQVEEIILDNKIKKEKILGISIAAPGQVDIINRSVLYYPLIKGLVNYPLAEVLERRLNLNIIIQNNCSALAFGEYLYGDIEHDNSLFTFNLRRGVNGALVHNGEIYQTIRGTTLEIGHIPINFDGPKCTYSRKGCLQAYILNIDTEPSNPIFSDLEDNPDKEKVDNILEEAARYLTFGMEAIITFYSPSTFIIETCSEKVSKILAEKVQRNLEKSKETSFIPHVSVYGKKYDKLITQLGLVELLIRNYLE